MNYGKRMLTSLIESGIAVSNGIMKCFNNLAEKGKISAAVSRYQADRGSILGSFGGLLAGLLLI